MAVKEEKPVVGEEEIAETKTRRPKIKNKKKLIRNIIIGVLAVAIILGVFRFCKRGDEDKSAAVISARAVTRGNVTNYLSGSGMIEAMDSYDIVAMVQGDILSAPFEEGEIVNEDDVLFVFDSEDAQQSLQSQQNSYNSQKISYDSEQKKWDKFSVKAPVSGYVKGISSSLRVGDDVSNGQVLATVNSQTVEVSIPFAASAASAVYVGATAQLSSSKYMTNNIYGTVTGVDSVYAGSFNVTVEFANPGQLEEGDILGATIGGIQSAGTGSCRVANKVEAEIKGEISQIHVKNGDFVQAGCVMFTLDDEDTKNSLRQNQISFDNAGISLQKAYDALENYTIKSPITGTVIQKNYKAGDTLGMSSNSAVLATIADISKMKFTINVDELDIAGVQIGQKVEVTADAITGKRFEGEITKIIQQGSGTSGVTTYPVEVTIAEPGELKIGMNVTGTVIMSSAENVIKVPLESVSMRGGKTYVQVLKDDVRKKVFGDGATANGANAQPQGGKPQGNAPQGNMPQGGAPQGNAPQGNMPQGGAPQGNAPQGNMPQGGAPQGNAPQSGGAPNAQPKKNENKDYTFTENDFEEREVLTGVSSDDEIEIISGLAVGEYVQVVQTVNNRSNNGFGGFHGNMGGGMSSGGMGGGMPSGGGNMRGGMSGGMPSGGSNMRGGMGGNMGGMGGR